MFAYNNIQYYVRAWVQVRYNAEREQRAPNSMP